MLQFCQKMIYKVSSQFTNQLTKNFEAEKNLSNNKTKELEVQLANTKENYEKLLQKFNLLKIEYNEKKDKEKNLRIEKESINKYK